jgi:hypothetical protein
VSVEASFGGKLAQQFFDVLRNSRRLRSNALVAFWMGTVLRGRK